MRKILIINKEMPELSKDPFIKIKKNKTIIKNYNLMTSEFCADKQYKFFLEEWEVWNKDRIQICLSNNGDSLKPVHIIDDQKNGIKCLFQTEKLLILKASNGIYELTKNTIDQRGFITTSCISVGKYNNFEDIKDKLDKQFHDMLYTVIMRMEKYKEEGYLSPLYYTIM